MHQITWGLFVGAAFALFAGSVRAAGPVVWAVDPLVKVFQDDLPGPGWSVPSEVARGEYATWQVVIRSDAPMTDLRVASGRFARSGRIVEDIPIPSARFVGYVPVAIPTPRPARDTLRVPPADFPDPLLEDASMDVPAGKTQPVWVTVRIPKTVRPGEYRATLRLTAKSPGGPVALEAPLALRVYNVSVRPQRLKVTNWFNLSSPHMAAQRKPFSPEYWDLVKRYARNMAEHRQNVARIITLDFARFSMHPDGTLAVDWSRFDRIVRIFQAEGIHTIEGGHLGGRSGDWESPFVMYVGRVENGKVVMGAADPTSPEAVRFHAFFLQALVRHLKEKGWSENYIQHIADEPVSTNIDSYRAIAGLVRKYAPGMKIVEATHSKDLVGSIDVWVPQLDHLHQASDYYAARRAAGDEVWFYTCLYPQGEYANRLMELPLVKTRLLHWINDRYGLTGYLHWGYNYWGKDSPYLVTNREHGGGTVLPAGDAWIVYPGPKGPIDSIRFEAMRDGIADYELLQMLRERRPEEADLLVKKHILDYDRYNTSVPEFRNTRRALLEALEPR